jgi:hypothetical protein
VTTEPRITAARPRRWWFAVLLGVAPHLSLLIWFAWPPITFWYGGETRSGFSVGQGDEAGAPYATYSWAELIIVPVAVLVVMALAVSRRTRFWALWALLGTLAGATAVLLVLATAAVVWRMAY